MSERAEAPPGDSPSEDPYRVIFEHAPDAVIVVDEGGTILDANHQAAMLFGYPGPELIGMCVEQLMPYDVRSTHAAHRAGYMATPRVRPMGAGLDLMARRADGSEVAVDISLSPLPGRLFAAAIRDVTEWRAAADELRRSQARTERAAEALLEANQELRLRAAVAEHLAEGVALVRAADGVIVYTNDRWDKLFGYGPGELVGRSISTVSEGPARSAWSTASGRARSRTSAATAAGGGRWPASPPSPIPSTATSASPSTRTSRPGGWPWRRRRRARPASTASSTPAPSAWPSSTRPAASPA